MNSYAVIYKGNNKLYYFKSSEKFEIDDEVIVDTDKGEQYAKIVKIVDSLKTYSLPVLCRIDADEDEEISVEVVPGNVSVTITVE